MPVQKKQKLAKTLKPGESVVIDETRITFERISNGGRVTLLIECPAASVVSKQRQLFNEANDDE